MKIIFLSKKLFYLEYPYLYTPASHALCLFAFFSFSTTIYGYGVSKDKDEGMQIRIFKVE